MKLFLMRHGEASWDAASDYDRRLTERGGQQVLAQAEKLVREMQAINRVFTSPIVRARQTCDLYLDAIAYQGTVSQVDWLRHETSAGKAIEALYTTLGNDFQGEVILFSHQPLASQF
ncbi:MAG: histidine phosphatase family protein, partial [Pseudomonadales bacterium]|nr:histidine phosphatase family protein [Pseudomonadales bacterium]